DTPGARHTAATPRKSPSDEYSLAVQSISPFSVPAGSSSAASHDTAASSTRICRSIDRTWDQCEWLQQKIETSFRLQALPPFPERPSSKKATDQLYVERYRARIERWLNRLGTREHVCQSASMDYFISTKMSDKDVGSSAKQSFSSLLLNFFGGGTTQNDRGFRIYAPISEIDDFDEDEEERRREYIASLEECAQELGVAVKNAHAQEEALGKGIVKAVLAITRAFKAEALLPSPRDSEVVLTSGANCDQLAAAHTSIDHQRLDVSLALLHNSAEAYYWSTKELATWKEFNVVDVLLEFNAMVGGVKEVMNHATQTLMLYEKAMLRHQTHEQRANSLRIQYPSADPSVKHANEQEAESEREMELAHQEYTDANEGASRELVRFERERAHGIHKALESMAAIELEAARTRCQELRALCRRIRGIQMIKDPPHPRTNIGPMLWQAADSLYPSMPLTPGVSASTSSPFAPTHTRASSTTAIASNQLVSSTSLSTRPAHKYSASTSSGTRTAGPATPSHRIHDLNIRRAHTMDDTDLDEVDITNIGSRSKPGRNHSVFLETADTTHDYSPLSAPLHRARTSPAVGTSSSAGSSSGTPLRHKKRWNGRISTLPFQGYDPKADQTPRAVVGQDRLEEMAAEAEMEAELVRSGILTARKISRKRSAPNYSASGSLSAGLQPPPVLPAFRPQSRGSAPPSQLRHANSCTNISTISQPVSPSEYLQYSRQNLHSSLSRASSSGPSTGHPGARIPPAFAAQRGRDVKGKGRAFAV
ncbi:hypothetical protein IWW52_004582, partial [Coemansia sp. RSA 2704]